MNILSGILVLLLAILSTVLCIILLKPIASVIGLVDHPSARKKHHGSIPLIGGIAIWLALSMCLPTIGPVKDSIFLLLSGLLLVIVGAADDASEISPSLRLVLHVIAALLITVGGGIVVEDLGELFIPGFEISLGILAVPFTVFAIVALINAVNMSDGVDGLSGMQSLIPLAGLAMLAGFLDDQKHFLPLVAICGCIAGFLAFNLRTPWRRSAEVFLGDAGSNFLGVILAWFLIDMSQGDDAILSPVAVLWFALLLIYDTIEVVARRIIRHRSPLRPDREHLHHVFLLARFSVPETVLTMSAITLLGVLVGIASTILDIPDSVLLGAFTLFGILFLRMILRTWSAMQFLYRSICRRQGERRQRRSESPVGYERRLGQDRRCRVGTAVVSNLNVGNAVGGGLLRTDQVSEQHIDLPESADGSV